MQCGVHSKLKHPFLHPSFPPPSPFRPPFPAPQARIILVSVLPCPLPIKSLGRWVQRVEAVGVFLAPGAREWQG